jgi:5,10-methylene-tetrahydrofolate dehydrogenase/methenyl tetrahydrofolate cyclohydrolase
LTLISGCLLRHDGHLRIRMRVAFPPATVIPIVGFLVIRGAAVDLGLANAAAVVVGGSRGMGLATARCLADDDARVAVAARSRDGGPDFT